MHRRRRGAGHGVARTGRRPPPLSLGGRALTGEPGERRLGGIEGFVREVKEQRLVAAPPADRHDRTVRGGDRLAQKLNAFSLETLQMGACHRLDLRGYLRGPARNAREG